MRVIIFLFSFLCTCASISAQETKTMSAKYCMTYVDYQNNKLYQGAVLWPVEKSRGLHRSQGQFFDPRFSFYVSCLDLEEGVL